MPRAHLGDRLQRADLVVRELHATSAVSGRTAAITAAASKRPERSTPTIGHVDVGRATLSRTHECSTAVVTTCPRRDRASAPDTAVLTASVPDDVNTTSRGRAPKNAATCSRAFSSATRVRAALGVQAAGVAE